MVFHKYGKIKPIGYEENAELLTSPEDDIYIEEKIDGGNFRFMLKDGRIIFGSRTQSIGDSTREIGGNWKRCVEYIKEKLPTKDLEKLKPESSSFVFYGECCIKHTFDYDWEKIPPYLGFDILDLNTDKFLGYEEKLNIFTELGLHMVPLIKIVKAKDIIKLDDSIVPKSVYSSPSSPPEHQQAEGIVFKNYNKQIFAKYVREKFKEENRKTFGEGKKFAKNDDERIVAIYCTNSRIEKNIYKLLDYGNKLELPLMKHLPKEVLTDIYEENWNEICFSSWSVNFKNIRKKITGRCLNVLKKMITNSAL